MQNRAIERITELEDGLQLEDIAREVDHNVSKGAKENTPILSGRSMRRHNSLIMLSC